MPPIPPTEPTDWYIVVPLPDPQEHTHEDGTKQVLQGAAQLFVVGANDMDDAAALTWKHGYEFCAVVLATYYKRPT